MCVITSLPVKNIDFVTQKLNTRHLVNDAYLCSYLVLHCEPQDDDDNLGQQNEQHDNSVLENKLQHLLMHYDIINKSLH